MTTTVPDGVQKDVGISVEDLAALYLLDSIKQFGPQKFKHLHEAHLTPSDVIREPDRLPIPGKRGESYRAELRLKKDGVYESLLERATKQILRAHELAGVILTYAHPFYPPVVYRSNYPVPLLFARGSLEVLRNELTVACVGSRKIRPPYTRLHASFAQHACSRGFTIVSGFATGADTIGHEAAWKNAGKTTCVMPGGLDRPFPPENRQLWETFLNYSGSVLISEFAFGTGASALTLRKRNKLIVACALGVLVSQSSKTGGAMNAYRFALEQSKPIATFASDSTADSAGNEFITREPKAHAVALPLTEDQLPTPAGEWLQQLSSSISTEHSGTATPGTLK
jgi:DNA protecting protein DprA